MLRDVDDDKPHKRRRILTWTKIGVPTLFLSTLTTGVVISLFPISLLKSSQKLDDSEIKDDNSTNNGNTNNGSSTTDKKITPVFSTKSQLNLKGSLSEIYDGQTDTNELLTKYGKKKFRFSYFKLFRNKRY